MIRRFLKNLGLVFNGMVHPQKDYVAYVKVFSSEIFSRDFSKASGAHFSSRGHSVYDISVSMIEKVHSPDELLREEWESMFIKKV